MPPVIVYTDGACRGNPGPGGWGVYIEENGESRELNGGDPATTNNRMELLAAITALESLPEGTPVELHTDSTYVKNGITDWMNKWQRNGWRTSAGKPVKNQDLWVRLADAAARHRVDWRWVKGHAGVPGNERADALANAAIDAL